MKKKTVVFIVSIIIALAVGGVSALLTMDSMERFSELEQPPLSPPSWLFPIVWTILFILMGISAARIYNIGGRGGNSSALTVYGIQLFVNFMWPVIFFSLELRLAALFWLLLLLALVILMIVRFYRIDKTAAYLQIPYLIWLLFAAYLNTGVFILNG